MKKSFWGAAAALLLVAASPLYATAAGPAGGGSGSIGRYIVVLENDVAHPGSIASRHARSLDAETTHVYRSALKGYAARMSSRAAASLADNPNVAWVERDRRVSISAQTRPTGIRRIGADRSPTANINGADDRVNVDVAVIDTGVDTDHADLNVVGGRNCSTGRSFDDGHGHGSHVAGTVGAKDNATGVVGVAPGARLYAVRVLNNAGSGSTSSVTCGIDWVAANASTIEVANMSLGGSGSDDGNCGRTNNDVEHRAICNAVSRGVTFAVAAGNSHANASGFIPAAYDEVITVSALADFNGAPGGGAAATCRADVDDTFADFSNFGADVDLIAPGVCINSTWKGNGYNTISGTSMASPHAAGAAALYKATHPGASPATVKSALQSAGTLDWTWPSQDGDNIKEKLVNVAGF